MIAGGAVPGIVAMDVVKVSHLAPDQSLVVEADRAIYAGWRVYAEIMWVVEGASAWRGRDRRRLKRERRKFVALRRPS